MKIETVFRIMILSWFVAGNPVMAITAIGFGDSITAGRVGVDDGSVLACGKQIVPASEELRDKAARNKLERCPCPEQPTVLPKPDELPKYQCDGKNNLAKLGDVRQGGYIRKLDLLLNEKIGQSTVYNWGSPGERTSRPSSVPAENLSTSIPLAKNDGLFTGDSFAFDSKTFPKCTRTKIEDEGQFIEELVDESVIRRDERSGVAARSTLGIYRIMKAVTGREAVYILIMEGTNDISLELNNKLNNKPNTLAANITKNNLEVMARTAITCGVIPVLATITYRFDGETKEEKEARRDAVINDYNPAIRELAQEMALWPELQELVQLKGVAFPRLADQFAALACTPKELKELEKLNPDTPPNVAKVCPGWETQSKKFLQESDWLHLNDEGNRLVAETFFEALFPDKDARHTEIKDSASEPNLLGEGGILEEIYGISNLKRIDDNEDQYWENLGNATVDATATGKVAFNAKPEQLNYLDKDNVLKDVFVVSTAHQGKIEAFGQLPPKDKLPTFRWALTADDTDVPPFFSSQPSDSRDDADHMVTWEITGGASEGNNVGNYVIAWEDLPIPGADRDFQDLVVEVSNVKPINEVVNDLFPPIGSDDVEREPFDSTIIPAAPGGVFKFKATFLNDTTSTLKEPRIKILELSNTVDRTKDPVLLDASKESLGGVGAIVKPDDPPVAPCVGDDKMLLPGQCMTVTFRIGLKSPPKPFRLFVDVLGIRPPSP